MTLLLKPRHHPPAGLLLRLSDLLVGRLSPGKPMMSPLLPPRSCLMLARGSMHRLRLVMTRETSKATQRRQLNSSRRWVA